MFVLALQKVLSGSGRSTRRCISPYFCTYRYIVMYFPIRRSLPALPEPDNTFWTASTVTAFRSFQKKMMELTKSLRLVFSSRINTVEQLI